MIARVLMCDLRLALANLDISKSSTRSTDSENLHDHIGGGIVVNCLRECLIALGY